MKGRVALAGVLLAVVLAGALAVELDASAERRHRAEAHASAREDPNPGSAGTITLSTYVFALIAVGSCIVGSVFSFVASKIIDTIKGQ